ncbi:hypothetical protein WJX73_008338 [Symbiochloris irregularis]|uniref:DUF72 domain-containing protein n=1 Tax=Symbiochloris irregularis TaxID=706552 RepID=A0AAW1NYB4_9CHLO
MIDRGALLAAAEKRKAAVETIDLTRDDDDVRIPTSAGCATKVEIINGNIVRSVEVVKPKQRKQSEPKRRKRSEAATPSTQPASQHTGRCLPGPSSGSRRVRITTSGALGCPVEEYVQAFDTLELNTTFYNIPRDSMWRGWRKKAPRESFQYVVKVNDYFTHTKRLNIDADWIKEWQSFWEKCQLLRPYLGPILFQFPPSFKIGTKRNALAKLNALQQLSQVLDPDQHFVFEFRHTSWYCPEVYAVLAENDWCLANIHVIAGVSMDGESWIRELPDGPWPRTEAETPPCSWGFYRRLHGTEGQYAGAYGDAILRGYLDTACTHAVQGRTAYIAFNNTVADMDDVLSGRQPVRSSAQKDAELCAQLLQGPGGPWA